MTDGLNDLPKWVFLGCIAVIILTSLAILYVAFHNRRSTKINPIHFHTTLFSEIFWTLIPILILFAMMIPAIRMVFKIGI